MEETMITRIKRQRLEAMKKHRQTRHVETKNIIRRHRRFESDEMPVTAQEIVDECSFMLANVVLVQDWGIGGKQFAIAWSDDESAVAILTDEDGFVSLNVLNDTRNADVIHEEFRTMKDVDDSRWFKPF
jgi:hypothetical protein